MRNSDKVRCPECGLKTRLVDGAYPRHYVSKGVPCLATWTKPSDWKGTSHAAAFGPKHKETDANDSR